MQLIERYIYDVTRRLPEKDRDDVSRELETSIADMLPDSPDEQAVTEVLNRLGAPYKFAEQYRQQPRYLISPAMYDQYVTSLKSIVIAVACVLACVGVVLGAGSLPDNASANDIIGMIIRESVSFAFEGALMAIFWVTLCYVIADRAGIKKKEWTVADLPQVPKETDVTISRSSVFVSAALTVIFTAVFITLIQDGRIFGGALLVVDGREIISPVTQAALERMIPFIVTTAALSLAMDALKFFYGRWNVILCAANAVHNLIGAGIAIYVLSWPDLINREMLVSVDLPNLITQSGTVTFLPAAAAIVVIIAVIDIGAGIKNTFKSR